MDEATPSANSETEQKPPLAPDRPRPRKKGFRCIVGGCSNTAYDGFIMHNMPGKVPPEGERFTTTQKAWVDFIGRKRAFDTRLARTYKRISVCSGHFLESDYEPSQVMMFKYGHRSNPPTLKKDAIPAVDIANQPFPEDWFVTTSTDQPSSTSSSTSQPASPQRDPVPYMEDVDIEGSDTAGPSNPCTDEIETSSASDQGDSAYPYLVKRRRKSTHVRKKEIQAICVEYAEKAEEDRARKRAEDILDRSKGEQCSVKMVNHRVGIRKGYRSCKVQVNPKKPKTVSKGVQANLFNKTENVMAVLQCADAASQTTKSCTVQEEEQEIQGQDDDDDDSDDIDDGDDELKDPTYDPLSSSDEEIQDVTQSASILEEDKFIVFESKLLELFRVCENCLAKPVRVEKMRPKSYGSQLKIISTCNRCDHVREWHSQPKIGNVMAGNLLLSAAILYGGASPTKVLRVLNHMNLKVISNQTFLDHQRNYLQPAIIRVSQRQQRQLLNQVEPGEKLVIGGDGRSDSPGHSAKFGSYTFMDMKRKKVIDVQLVQSNEVTSSNAMEKEGLARGLANLHGKGLKVGTLITDRHAQVAKWVRETYPDIDHRYDVWHIAKGIKKKITAVAKLKDCELAGAWKRSIVNHVYWSAVSTPDGDGEVMIAKFKSIENHIRNVHTDHSALFPKCAHAEEYPQREWMKEGTKVFEKLTQEVMKPRLLNDMKKMSPLDQTSSVEAFHSVLLYWCPKMLAFSYSGMKCRLYLAMMHWNENADRGQAIKTDGTPMYKITYPKAKAGGHTVSEVLTNCTFNYVVALMEETMQLVSRKQKLRPQIAELQEKPALCSQFERPDKAQAVQELEAHRRFAKK